MKSHDLQSRMHLRPQKTSRVLYFVCELQRCGESDFISRVNVQAPEGVDAETAEERTLLFSTN